jgi:MFS family permease
MSLETTLADDGRPIRPLPVRQLVRVSLYWLGLSSIFAGLETILAGRLEFTGMVPHSEVGGTLFRLTIAGAVIAALVQPTIGSISDYTISRWGRRKPYIFIGSVLDVVFLAAIATSNELVAIAVFIALLQFSSNFAQGPFQGYVPDLVPAQQVGLASGLVGLFSVLGNATGFIVGSLAVASGQFGLGTLSLGVIELVTMLIVVIGVDEGRAAKPRQGRSWLTIAGDAWGTDILRERSFVFLVASRLFVLMGGAVLLKLGLFYLTRSQGLDQRAAGNTLVIVSVIVATATAIAVIPAARLSDRFGRKRVIYGATALGAAGLLTEAVAPTLPFAYLGAALMGIGTGSFLAVDWALMTDIIPKASSGRYMGISNVATASAGVFAIAIGGGLIMDRIGPLDTGPRAAMLFGAVSYGIGALLLRPVQERRRGDEEVLVAPAVAPA